MIAENKTRITVDEDKAIVAQIDAMAEAEGVARADIIRRAIRRLLFSMPNIITIDKLSPEPIEEAA